MTDCLSEKTHMTIDERLSQLQKDIYHINKLAFPLHFQARYNKLARNGLIEKIRSYMSHDNVSIECDLVTIGWLVIAFYVGQDERYCDLQNIIKRLYHVSRIDGVFVHEDLKLFHMALEIGIRMINGEGETDSFEQSEFNYEQHNALCDDFYRTRQSESHSQQNEDAHSKVQYLIQTLKFLKKDPQCTDRAIFTTSPLYKESIILAQLTPTGYSAARTILNRAINAVSPSWAIIDTTDVDYQTKVKTFKEALYNLKNEVLTAYRSKNCDTNSAMTLANLALGLAQRIEQ